MDLIQFDWNMEIDGYYFYGMFYRKDDIVFATCAHVGAIAEGNERFFALQNIRKELKYHASL